QHFAANESGNTKITITNLLPNTDYNYNILAKNQAGNSLGALKKSFKTDKLPTKPVFSEFLIYDISMTSVRFSGKVNPMGATTDLSFHYGIDLMELNQTLAIDPATVNHTDSLFHYTAELNDLNPATKYFFQISGKNQKGIGHIDSNFTTLADTDPPNITNISYLPEKPGILEAITISADISDNTGINTATMNYWVGGDPQSNSITMVGGTDNSYSAAIPANRVSIAGVAFSIVADDIYSNVGLSDTSSLNISFLNITSNSTQSAFPQGFPSSVWRLISIPGILSEYSITSTIGSVIGEQNDENWKFYSYSGNALLENSGTFQDNNALWLYQRNGENLNFEVKNGKTLNNAEYKITLVSGWNLFGSGFAFPVEVDADQLQFFGPIAYGNDGSEGWSDVLTTLKPWGGYAIYNRRPISVDLILKPVETANGLKKKNIASDGWKLKISASGSVYTDPANYIGQHSLASDEYDVYDNPEPMNIDKGISLTTGPSLRQACTERSRSAQTNHSSTLLSSDIRSLETENHLWDVDIAVKGENGPIRLDFTELGEFPAEMSLKCLNLTTREISDLSSQKSVILHYYNEKIPSHLKIATGSEAYIESIFNDILASLPDNFALRQNYPNPFNPLTTLEFSLPIPELITLEIYNILGQKVATLMNGWQDLGTHQIQWQGTFDSGIQAPSGIYFSVLKSKNHIKKCKMVLIR
ncbi:MAG: T9SS type A sorting domain-containing protein, partial [Candidatus Marinimicrobia bacterium]|nr:T9SS type A sorting domain-containing protein [Candidatus Neomarinimicrobiota bacterium]